MHGDLSKMIEIGQSALGSLGIVSEPDGSSLMYVRRIPARGALAAEEIDLLASAARWMTTIREPRVCAPLLVQAEGATLSVATTYHEGEPLRSLLRLASFRARPFPINVALRVAMDVLAAARAIASMGAPQRIGRSLCGGLLPDSIVVGRDGTTTLLDAGVASAATRIPMLSNQPDVIGYRSPEQLTSWETVDERTDVFAVGVLLWEMLSNKRLFVGTTSEVVAERVRSFVVPSLENVRPAKGEPVPYGLTDVVQRAMQRPIEQRQQGIGALLEELASIGGRQPATDTEVAAFVEDLAGRTIDARNRTIERGARPLIARRTVDLAARPAAAPSRPAPTMPSIPVASVVRETPSNPPSAPGSRDQHRPMTRHRTLVGVAPPGLNLPSPPSAVSSSDARSSVPDARQPATRPRSLPRSRTLVGVAPPALGAAAPNPMARVPAQPSPPALSDLGDSPAVLPVQLEPVQDPGVDSPAAERSSPITLPGASALPLPSRPSQDSSRLPPVEIADPDGIRLPGVASLPVPPAAPKPAQDQVSEQATAASAPEPIFSTAEQEAGLSSTDIGSASTVDAVPEPAPVEDSDLELPVSVLRPAIPRLAWFVGAGVLLLLVVVVLLLTLHGTQGPVQVDTEPSAKEPTHQESATSKRASSTPAPIAAPKGRTGADTSAATSDTSSVKVATTDQTAAPSAPDAATADEPKSGTEDQPSTEKPTRENSEHLSSKARRVQPSTSRAGTKKKVYVPSGI